MILISICSFPWWLPWLLSFLLGLLAAWGLWSKYKSRVDDLESEMFGLRKKISSLEGDLASCQARRAEVESELALVKGRLREMEVEAKLGAVGIVSNQSSGSEDDQGKNQDEDSGIDENEGGDDSGIMAGTPSVTGSGSTDSGSLSIYTALKEDNLQVVEGVGPKMESVLKDNGVNSLIKLGGESPSGLRDILNKYGDKYRIIDPTTWPEQADLAATGRWEDLIVMQKSLDTGRSDRATGTTDSKVEKILIRMGVLKKWAKDDLRAIEGIGPKIAGLLKEDGIDTWRALSEVSVERIQGVLDNAGKRYQLADPTTWPKQAGMAADGKWDELRAYQDRLKGGKE